MTVYHQHPSYAARILASQNARQNIVMMTKFARCVEICTSWGVLCGRSNEHTSETFRWVQQWPQAEKWFVFARARSTRQPWQPRPQSTHQQNTIADVSPPARAGIAVSRVCQRFDSCSCSCRHKHACIHTYNAVPCAVSRIVPRHSFISTPRVHARKNLDSQTDSLADSLVHHGRSLRVWQRLASTTFEDLHHTPIATFLLRNGRRS